MFWSLPQTELWQAHALGCQYSHLAHSKSVWAIWQPSNLRTSSISTGSPPNTHPAGHRFFSASFCYFISWIHIHRRLKKWSISCREFAPPAREDCDHRRACYRLFVTRSRKRALKSIWSLLRYWDSKNALTAHFIVLFEASPYLKR